VTDRIANLLAAVLAAAFGGYLIVSARSFSAMGALMPNLVGAVLVLLGAALAVAAIVRPALVAIDLPARGPWLRPLVFVGLFGVLVAALPAAGFVPTVVVGGVLASLIVPRERPWTPGSALLHLGVIALSAVSLWLVLERVLNVPLPDGTLVR
jgi:hypothetical protein